MAIPSATKTALQAASVRARTTSGTNFMPSPLDGLTGQDYKDVVTALVALSPILTSANSGTAYTFDGSVSTRFLITLTGNVTFSMSNQQAGETYTIMLRQDATGSRTVTWGAAFAFTGGTPPTITATASKTCTLTFISDGTTMYYTGSALNMT